MFPRVWNCCQVCRVWHRLHVSPRLALVTCFSAFETVPKFTAFDTVYMLHPVKTVPKFAAFHTGYMFLRSWYCVWRWLYVSPGLKLFPSLPRLTMVSSFPAFEAVSKFAAFDTGLYKFFAAFKTSTGVDFYLVRRRRPASPKWRITGLSSTRYCRLAWWKRYSVSIFSLQIAIQLFNIGWENLEDNILVLFCILPLDPRLLPSLPHPHKLHLTHQQLRQQLDYQYRTTVKTK